MPTTIRVIDDFLSEQADIGPHPARWLHFGAAHFVGDDGHPRQEGGLLHVRAAGAHPVSGHPMFTRSMACERQQPQTALPGGLDHVKWLVYSQETHGDFPGYRCTGSEPLTFEAVYRAETFGTEHHPFGGAVSAHDDDLRLACGTMSIIDFETLLVFDFMLTNRGIYAFYERLPYARDRLGHYASFSFARRVADRTPGDWHRLSIGYDDIAGTVTWAVEGQTVMRVDRLGYLLDRGEMLLDHGGEEVAVRPQQLACGFGMLTLLDAARPGGGSGLVRLSDQPDFYFDPQRGSPHPARFVDEDSMDESRLFGQGAAIEIRGYSVGGARPCLSQR